MSRQLNWVAEQPTKNQAYTFYGSSHNIGSGDQVIGNVSNISGISIFKDGVSAGASTNSPSHIGGGVFKLDLTADEMNADIVILVIDGTTTIGDMVYAIKTSTSGASGLSMDTPVTGAKIFPASNPTLGDVLNGIYIFFKKNKNRTIIK